ncbi:hypothetical protein V2I01_43110 [Micromonospora sp. BRA006-A]|nr:hypothetical protein [Micromonospora sp. BRA006-A]
MTGSPGCCAAPRSGSPSWWPATCCSPRPAGAPAAGCRPGSILTWLLVTHAVLLGGLAAVLIWHRLRVRGHQPPNGLGALVVAAAAGSRWPTPPSWSSAPPTCWTGRVPGGRHTGPGARVHLGDLRLLPGAAGHPGGRGRGGAGVPARPDAGRRGDRRAGLPVAAGRGGAPAAAGRTMIVRARFTDLLVPLAVLFAVMAGLGAATTAMALVRSDPGDTLEHRTHVPAELVMFGIEVGGVAISAAVLALILAGIFAYRSPGSGTTSACSSTWPRSGPGRRTRSPRPATPSEAVPELARRITYLVHSGNGVLLSGYSHGSVLVAATVLQLPAEVSARVALLTYSSPLRIALRPAVPRLRRRRDAARDRRPGRLAVAQPVARHRRAGRMDLLSAPRGRAGPRHRPGGDCGPSSPGSG